MKRSVTNLKSALKRSVLAASVLGIALVAGAPAMAGPKLFAFSNTTMTINGTTETTANGNVDPFVIELFANANECLRIAVTFQGQDLEATLVGPDGRTWRDDDSGGSNRPLLKAITVTRGWHILRISHFAGSSVNSDFTAQIFRGASNSVLCSPPTLPSVLSKAEGGSKAPVAAQKRPGGTQ